MDKSEKTSTLVLEYVEWKLSSVVTFTSSDLECWTRDLYVKGGKGNVILGQARRELQWALKSRGARKVRQLRVVKEDRDLFHAHEMGV